MNLIKNIKSIFSPQNVYAHCDIPCGIYDPISAKIAAQTVLKMTMRMEDIDLSNGVTKVEQPNGIVRLIRVKEYHSQIVKNELNILWSDYFKPEHLEKYPELHTLFWNANKLAGANKQNVSSKSAKELVGVVDEISTIFWESKGIAYSDPNSEIRFGA
jgi:nickel superoxide dismutase